MRQSEVSGESAASLSGTMCLLMDPQGFDVDRRTGFQIQIDLRLKSASQEPDFRIISSRRRDGSGWGNVSLGFESADTKDNGRKACPTSLGI